MRYRGFRALVVVIPFLALISFPLVNRNNWLVKDIHNFENRKLHSSPSLLATPIDSFPRQYERYYNDAFPLRSAMLRQYSLLALTVWRKSPCPEFVDIGYDGWLFFTGDEFKAATGTKEFNVAEKNQILANLERRADFLRSLNCSLYVMIAPAKAAIYPEKVAFGALRSADSSLGEKLLAFMQPHKTLHCVNVYGALRAGKKSYNTYYLTDNHWTDVGALLASNEFFSIARQAFPAVAPYTGVDFSIVPRDTFGGNTSAVLGVKDLFRDTKYRLIPRIPLQSVRVNSNHYRSPEAFPYPYLFEQRRIVQNSKAPKLLVIGDSFGEQIFPLLSEKFSCTLKIWDNWEYTLHEDIVKAERPDLMLLLIHEKNLPTLLEDHEGIEPPHPH